MKTNMRTRRYSEKTNPKLYWHSNQELVRFGHKREQTVDFPLITIQKAKLQPHIYICGSKNKIYKEENMSPWEAFYQSFSLKTEHLKRPPETLDPYGCVSVLSWLSPSDLPGSDTKH